MAKPTEDTPAVDAGGVPHGSSGEETEASSTVADQHTQEHTQEKSKDTFPSPIHESDDDDLEAQRVSLVNPPFVRDAANNRKESKH